MLAEVIISDKKSICKFDGPLRMNPTITVAVALSIDIVVAKDWGNGADVEFTVKRRLELVFLL